MMTKNKREIIHVLTSVQIYDGKYRAVKFGRTTSRLIERMMVKFLWAIDATFPGLNYIWRTRGIEGRIEAVVNQPRGWIFHPPSSWRARTRAENERAGIYTTGFRFCSRCNRAASRPSVHFLWECSRLPRGVGPPCAACLSESKPGQSSPSLSLSFYSFLSLLSFVQFFFSSPLAWNRNSSARREKDREKNSAIISLSDHFATLSFRSIFLHRGTEYFPPWFRVFLSPFT